MVPLLHFECVNVNFAWFKYCLTLFYHSPKKLNRKNDNKSTTAVNKVFFLSFFSKLLSKWEKTKVCLKPRIHGMGSANHTLAKTRGPQKGASVWCAGVTEEEESERWIVECPSSSFLWRGPATPAAWGELHSSWKPARWNNSNKHDTPWNTDSDRVTDKWLQRDIRRVIEILQDFALLTTPCSPWVRGLVRYIMETNTHKSKKNKNSAAWAKLLEN